MIIKANYYFMHRDENGFAWVSDFNIVEIKKPEICDKIEYNGKMYDVIDVDVEYDVYDIYLD
jgi:hypothetical protein